jgi:glycosyltransferase involved in cell wall biosynthesis
MPLSVGDIGPVAHAGPAAWIDAAEDDALIGWLYWPSGNDAALQVQATLNGMPVPLVVDVGARPDVASAIGVQGPVHALRIEVDVLAWHYDDFVLLRIDSGEASVQIWNGPVWELISSMVGRAWPLGAPSHVATAVAAGLRRQAPASAQANGAVERGAQLLRLAPELFMAGERGIGQRPDLPISRFQEHAYVRHVRDHPGYRTVRHFPAATVAGMVEYLVWSARSFADSYSFAPLPLGESDLRLLNRTVSDTGLRKGRAPGVMLSPLNLTTAQIPFVKERDGRVEAADEDELADWLLAWLGSWGWGHRGLRLMTADQWEFLSGGQMNVHRPGTVGAVSELNRYCRARMREHESLRSDYPDQRLPHVRQALMLDLMAVEVTHIGSDALLPEQFVRAVREPETLATIAAGIYPDGGPAPVVGPGTGGIGLSMAAKRVNVRVLGMLQSKSGLGQNARNSLRAFELAGLDVDDYSLSINDRSVLSSTNRPLPITPARVNLWHLNPDNVPEAVCTLDPSVYGSSYNIGFFAWELDLQPRAHTLAIDWVDEIWVPSEYCAESFRGATNKPIQVMPHAVEIPEGLVPFPRERLGMRAHDFLVHLSFDMHSWPQRKNPLGAIRAFQAAFDDDRARLLLKIRNGGNIGIVDSDLDQIGEAVLELADADDRILIDITERTYAETLSLVLAADCHMSLHRSEGFGYTLAEALALGVPVLCSEFGGSRDFCDARNAWLVPAAERLLTEGEYYLAPPGARWGEPDVRLAAEHLRAIRNGGAAVAARVADGLVRSEQFSIRRMSGLYSQRIAEIAALMGSATALRDGPGFVDERTSHVE